MKCTLTQDAGEALLKLFAGLGEGLNSLRGAKPYEELPSSAGRASAEVLVLVVWAWVAVVLGLVRVSRRL